MKILLDTHVFLWLIAGDVKMPVFFRRIALCCVDSLATLVPRLRDGHYNRVSYPD